MPLNLINILVSLINWDNNKIDMIIISMKTNWDCAWKVLSIVPETIIIQRMLGNEVVIVIVVDVVWVVVTVGGLAVQLQYQIWPKLSRNNSYFTYILAPQAESNTEWEFFYMKGGKLSHNTAGLNWQCFPSTTDIFARTLSHLKNNSQRRGISGTLVIGGKHICN